MKTMFDSSCLSFVLQEVRVLFMLFVFVYEYWCPARFSSNTTGVICEAGIAFPSGVHPRFQYDSCCLISSIWCKVWQNVVCLFVICLLVIVLSVLLFTTSGYPIGIFKLSSTTDLHSRPNTRLTRTVSLYYLCLLSSPIKSGSYNMLS